MSWDSLTLLGSIARSRRADGTAACACYIEFFGQSRVGIGFLDFGVRLKPDLRDWADAEPHYRHDRHKPQIAKNRHFVRGIPIAESAQVALVLYTTNGTPCAMSAIEPPK